MPPPITFVALLGVALLIGLACLILAGGGEPRLATRITEVAPFGMRGAIYHLVPELNSHQYALVTPVGTGLGLHLLTRRADGGWLIRTELGRIADSRDEGALLSKFGYVVQR